MERLTRTDKCDTLLVVDTISVWDTTNIRTLLLVCN